MVYDLRQVPIGMDSEYLLARLATVIFCVSVVQIHLGENLHMYEVIRMLRLRVFDKILGKCSQSVVCLFLDVTDDKMSMSPSRKQSRFFLISSKPTTILFSSGCLRI